MVYGAILEKGEQYYSYLKKVFSAIGDVQREYNWLITGCDCFPKSEEIARMLAQEYCWLSGEELTAIVNEDDFQWIWAVLSGFEKDIPKENVLKYPFPCADGYEGFWKVPLTMQHPLASIEIVSCDSSLTLIFSNRKEVIGSYRRAFPLSEDLALYNKALE